MAVETSFSEPHDLSRNLPEELQEVHPKTTYHAWRYMSHPGSRSQKFAKTTPRDTAHDQVPSPEDGKNALDLVNASATRPSSSTSETRSISNQSIVELTPIAITQDTAGNKSSKDLRRSSSRNGVSDEANNQEEETNNEEETQECQSCGVKFKAEKTMTTRDEFLYGEKYCNACRNVIGGAESSSDSGRAIKEEEERSSPRLKKQKQETKDKKKTWKWF